jgi:hypothetical protein
MTFSWWAVAWLGWLALFLAIEIPAYRRHRTFSEHVWWFIGRGQRLSWGLRFRRIALLAFGVWLCVHLTTGWV